MQNKTRRLRHGSRIGSDLGAIVTFQGIVSEERDSTYPRDVSWEIGHSLVNPSRAFRVQIGDARGPQVLVRGHHWTSARADERHGARMIVSEGTEHALTVLRTGRWFSGSLVSTAASSPSHRKTFCWHCGWTSGGKGVLRVPRHTPGTRASVHRGPS